MYNNKRKDLMRHDKNLSCMSMKVNKFMLIVEINNIISCWLYISNLKILTNKKLYLGHMFVLLFFGETCLRYISVQFGK